MDINHVLLQNHHNNNCFFFTFYSRANFLKCLQRDLALSTIEVVISYPFQVISYRMMAQFVGRETVYKY